MRCSVFLGLAVLVAACGPSDTIDVTAPEGPAPARPDSGRAAPGGAGGDGNEGAAGGARGGAPGGVDSADAPLDPVDAAADSPDGSGATDAPLAPDAPPPPDGPPLQADAPPVRLDTMPLPPDVAPPRDMTPAPPPDMSRPPDAPATGCLPTPANDEVISLFEDGNLGSRQVDGRGGTFWGAINTDNGATATLTVPEMPVRCGSSRALRFAGTATTATPILRLTLVQGTAQFYDASAYRGVRFSLRSGVAARVRFKLPDRNTASFGGMCVVCNDHWGADLDVTPDWKSFSITFASLAQTGTGDDEESLDEAALSAIELVVRNQAAFELFVDDVSFFR
jgi:hypothetical protein